MKQGEDNWGVEWEDILGPVVTVEGMDGFNHKGRHNS